MAAFGGLLLALQIVTLLAVYAHQAGERKVLERVREELDAMKAALTSVRVIREEVGELRNVLEQREEAPAGPELMAGFEALMGYSEQTAREAKR